MIMMNCEMAATKAAQVVRHGDHDLSADEDDDDDDKDDDDDEPCDGNAVFTPSDVDKAVLTLRAPLAHQ